METPNAVEAEGSPSPQPRAPGTQKPARVEPYTPAERDALVERLGRWEPADSEILLIARRLMVTQLVMEATYQEALAKARMEAGILNDLLAGIVEKHAGVFYVGEEEIERARARNARILMEPTADGKRMRLRLEGDCDGPGLKPGRKRQTARTKHPTRSCHCWFGTCTPATP
ncbi:MAG: hypothetical protein M5U26_03610 [Planctomycetota bacterium]|nr:hypothetical protein [Planctomycetota bacterium]